MLIAETKVRYITCTDTAKLVREALAKHFPNVKFSVRSKSYSGGASITVSWSDGPRAKRVEEILNQFEGRSFDGMNDLASSQDSWLLPDGSGDLAYRPDSYGGSIPGFVSDAPNPNAELVHFGANYVHSARHITDFDRKEAVAAAYIRLHCHCEGIPPSDMFGNDWVSNLSRQLVWDADESETMEKAFRRIIMREETLNAHQ